MNNDKSTNPNSPSDPHWEFSVTNDSEHYTVEVCERSSNKERLLAYCDTVERGKDTNE